VISTFPYSTGSFFLHRSQLIRLDVAFPLLPGR
jgi:hypothetical protein